MSSAAAPMGAAAPNKASGPRACAKLGGQERHLDARGTMDLPRGGGKKKIADYHDAFSRVKPTWPTRRCA
ncbi:hypothetical protein [Corynebacterium pseudodiphtheriticum]|uniref:hypothetical protein n=1 Tax=Corynebacterium pseudodiphtheriticum TaxID=37637 RepID=UPI00254119C5|nr:hypothetical protein [Corynebacterium pseudodiphtheriticum]MCG7252334.1 hypothetical protein [Corynebacterium pseudodiphtheriticum]MDK4304866.1 hypothetical protein [Corynebacterium pseudodiphtheriticum]